MATNDSMIQVKDLKKHYKMGTIKALDGVTVNINKGDVMAVIGPSGSGKSTFLRSLNLLEEPTGGAIIFNGVDITKKKYQDENGKTYQPVYRSILLRCQIIPVSGGHICRPSCRLPDITAL